MFERKKSAGKIHALPIDAIRPSPFQARTSFDEQELAGLAQSIREHGLLQHISVRKTADGSYEPVSYTHLDRNHHGKIARDDFRVKPGRLVLLVDEGNGRAARTAPGQGQVFPGQRFRSIKDGQDQPCLLYTSRCV